MGSASRDILLPALVQCQVRCQSLSPPEMDPRQSQEDLSRGGNREVILHPLKWMLSRNQRSNFSFIIGVFHHLEKGERNDGIAVNPWTSQE